MTWLPVELHPEVPPEGIPGERYFGAARVAQMRVHVQATAAEFARERGAYDAVHRALFEAVVGAHSYELFHQVVEKLRTA